MLGADKIIPLCEILNTTPDYLLGINNVNEKEKELLNENEINVLRYFLRNVDVLKETLNKMSDEGII